MASKIHAVGSPVASTEKTPKTTSPVKLTSVPTVSLKSELTIPSDSPVSAEASMMVIAQATTKRKKNQIVTTNASPRTLKKPKHSAVPSSFPVKIPIQVPETEEEYVKEETQKKKLVKKKPNRIWCNVL